MNFTVVIDWKSIGAIGASVACIILVSKMPADAAERVSIRAIDTCKDIAVAGNSDC